MTCACPCWAWFIKLWPELLLRRPGWVWLKLAFMQIPGPVCDVAGLLVTSPTCFCACGFSAWEAGGVGPEVLAACLGRLGAEESPWFRGLLPMAPRLAMFALFGCPWAWPPRPCCTGLLALTFPIPGLILELLPPRRSSDSCLCLEAASGTRFPLFKRPNSPPLGISSSGRSFSKSNNDPKSVLSFAEKPGELSLARLGLGGPSSKFSAIFTCSRKQPRARAAGPARAPGRGSAPAPAGCEGRASASRESRASAEGEGGRRAGWGRRRPNLSHSNSAPQRSPPAPGRRRRRRRRPRPPHPLPASRARHSAAGAPRRPGGPPGPGWQRRRPAGRLRQSPGTWCRRRAAASLPPRAPLN